MFKRYMGCFIFAICLLISVLLLQGKALDQHGHTENKSTPPPDSKAQLPSQTESPNSNTTPNKMPMNQDQDMPMDHKMPMNQAHDMSSQNHQGHMMSSINGGPFRSHLAVGSGTSLIPASTPGYMWMFMPTSWTIMLHGELKTGFNYQSGRRGVGKAESTNYLMVMASHKLVGGELMLRGMFSAEPLTVPHGGTPQLFQVGETYHGRSIIDAQHPHDLFMELALSYSYPISEQVALQFYGGPIGEPALGPTAFMHRASASEIPTAPLGHHWQDSTHISHGVFTTGLTAWRFKLEGSIFNAREPDEDRVALDFSPINSWSTRLWFTPTRNWAMQISHGHLVKPEAQEPGNISRTTASISYNRELSKGNWATSLIWGHNSKLQGNSNTYLLESTLNLQKNYLYTRMELADREGLAQENIFGRPAPEPESLFPSLRASSIPNNFEPQFRVGAFTFGGVRDVISTSKLLVGLGTDITFYHQPDTLKQVYGDHPMAMHFFIRIRPSKMNP